MDTWQLFCEAMRNFLKNARLAQEYDSIPRVCGDRLMYQVECHTIQLIGRYQGITITEIARRMNKTVSASSQVVRKLREKKLVTTTRNPGNQREIILKLTPDGMKVFEYQEKFDEKSRREVFSHFEEYTPVELQLFNQMLQRLQGPLANHLENSRHDLDALNGTAPESNTMGDHGTRDAARGSL